MASRRVILQWALGTAGLPAPALAQPAGTPGRPLRLVVPFATGGPAEALARAFVPKFGEALGQPVVVDTRPGAGGAIGSEAVAKAAPDGHTLLLGTSSTHSIGPALHPKTAYDAQADFTPVMALATAPGIVLVPNSSPAHTLQELVNLLRRQPGRFSYGSSGNGTIVHLATEYFKAETGTYIVHIPYRGTALAMNDLIAGTIDLLFDSLVTGLPQVRDGRVRALAVTSRDATPLAPGLPPVSDLIPGFEAATWFGLFGPRGLPAETTARLNRAANQALADPELQQRFARMGAEPRGGSAAALGALLAADAARWAALISSRHIRLD